MISTPKRAWFREETVIPLAPGVEATPGMLPLNLGRLQPAYYTGNLHKWVCAPKGAAFLWVREDKQAELQPAVISHGNNTPRPGRHTRVRVRTPAYRLSPYADYISNPAGCSRPVEQAMFSRT